ncbi:MAG TPA: endonuclease/exonuclease/phosphatase family protein [Sphingobacteriaceae bacterium]
MNRILMLLLCAGVFSTASAQTLSVMSYNIHHGADKNEVNTLDLMGKYIKDSGADLIGLQEVDSMCSRSGKVDQMKRLAEITGMHYAFVRHFAYDGGAYGLGILSRYPIASVKDHRLTNPAQESRKAVAGPSYGRDPVARRTAASIQYGAFLPEYRITPAPGR